MESAPQRFLVQIRHVQSVTPTSFRDCPLTTLFLGKENHVVEESVDEVQALMLAAVVGQTGPES